MTDDEQDPQNLIPRPTTTIKHQAFDKRTGMTLTELESFVRQAVELGINPFTSVKVTTGWRQQIQTLEASGPKIDQDRERA